MIFCMCIVLRVSNPFAIDFAPFSGTMGVWRVHYVLVDQGEDFVVEQIAASLVLQLKSSFFWNLLSRGRC